MAADIEAKNIAARAAADARRAELLAQQEAWVRRHVDAGNGEATPR